MNRSLKTRVLSMALAVSMVISLVQTTVFAVEAPQNTSTETTTAEFALPTGNLPSEMTVISDKKSTLAPGVLLNEVVLYDKNGDRVEMYVTTVDTNVDTVQIYANYKDNQNQSYGLQTLSDQVAAMEANYAEPFKVVAGINASYYDIATGKPTGAFVMEGIDVTTESEGNQYAFFAVLKDGTVMIGDKGEYSKYKGQIKEAIGGYVHIVKDGAVVAGLDKVTKYPRQTIGLTADGKVILMTADGSQAPQTIGLTYQEQAEVMLSLGCVDALHLDGGNSATFGCIPEGTDQFILTNTPSGAVERAVSNTLMIVSTKAADGAFDHATISGDYDYFVPYSQYTFTAAGVDASGGPANEIPDTVAWALSDPSFGTLENGTFISNGKLGAVDIQMIYNEKVVGSKTIQVVNPQTINFGAAEKTIPYGATSMLTITAIYNNNEVYCTADDFVFAITDENAGSLRGFAFTATNDATISGTTVTATYKHAAMDAITVALKFGKGSEVIFDFENGDVSQWLGIDKIKPWIDAANKNLLEKYPDAKYTILDTPASGNGTGTRTSSTFLATEDNGGLVKHGKNALGLTFNRVYDEDVGGWSYNYMFYTGETQVWRDLANNKNATKIGMWIYLPPEAAGLYARICRTFTETGSDKLLTNYDYLTVNGTKFSQFTNIPEDGWVYAEFDLTNNPYQSSLQFNPYEDYAINNGKSKDSNYYPGFLQFFVNTYDMEAEYVTIYIDDITLDYSDVTEDRDAPVISNATVAANADNYVALNGQTMTTNVLSFAATVTENTAKSNATGLDYSTAQIYVDGVKMSNVKGFTVNGSTLALSDIYLSNGTHEVTFEIADKQGNYTKLTKTLIVKGEAGNAIISLTGHNNGNHTPKAGSVYYIDITVSDAAQVAAISTALKMQTANTFELDQIIAANGVKFTYGYDKLNNTLTLNITHDGTLRGEQILVSVPVRVWSWSEKATGITAADQWKTANTPIVKIQCETQYGKVTYAQETLDTCYLTGFYSKIDVATEVDDSTPWHYHSEAAIDDLVPTCTEDGYSGRTYCDGCASVINWGTNIPATGHGYQLTNGVLKCTCGETFTGVHTDGKTYMDGILMADGWADESYFKDGVKLTGVHKVPAPNSADMFYYDFGQDGICANKAKYEGLFYDAETGVYRYAKIGVLTSGWAFIDSEWYYFDPVTMAAATGTYQYTTDIVYEFAENGRITKGFWAKSLYGIRYYYGPDYYETDWYTIDGKDYFFENGFRIDGGYQLTSNMSNEKIWYFFEEDGSCDRSKIIPDGFYTDRNGYGYSKDGKALTGLQNIDGTNYFFNHRGYAQTGKYSGYLFGDDYKGYTGIVDESGKKYYYENGQRKMAGLIEIDGSYYFASGDGEIATSQTTYVWMPNDIIPASDRTFDADGKMLDGIVERDGNYYYYNMGKPEMAGLIEIDGDYYFAKNGDGLIVTDQNYYIWKSNDILPESEREFGPDGKMLNGIVERDGNYYYYNMGKPEMAGLIEIDGSYYFAKDGDGLIVTNRVYYNWKGNGLLPKGDYEFGPDGKMLDGIVERDGNYYYYNMGKPEMAGLIEIDGDYYFAKNGDGLLVTDCTYYMWKANGIVLPSDREFGPDGKMLDGIVERDGNYYYYNMGKPEMAGLIEIDGDYYFAKNGDGLLVTDCTYYMWKANGIVPASDREFGPDGKMLNGIVERDGNYYYYNMGKPEMAGLIEIDGDYYFAKNSDGLIVTDQNYYIWKGNGILPESERLFGADGKMLDGFVTKDDGIYYYENGQIGTVGLNYIDGHYYFVGYDGKLVTNRTYYVWEPNGLSIRRDYTFDAQGRIVL